MKESQKALCDRFLANREVIKSCFRWESSYIYPVCAAMFAADNTVVKPEKLMTCKNLVKEQTGVFSNFRGMTRLSVITMLAKSEHPALLWSRTQKAYELLKKHFHATAPLTVAAVTLASLCEPSQTEKAAARTRAIYNLIKKEHPLLTSQDDSLMCVLAALSDKTDAQFVSEAEECHKLLCKRFRFVGNAVQSLSFVLTLCSGQPQEKCQRVIALYEAMQSRNMKFGKSFELPTLGIPALLDIDTDALVSEIEQISEFLKHQKGYGFFGCGKRQRLMHSVLLVADDYIGTGALTEAAASTTAIMQIAAQQAAICAAVAASAAASASASS